ncbi:MAG: dTDP-4-amino-4,6-dideoxygalactose transaminase [Putridiphycobacter sp.]
MNYKIPFNKPFLTGKETEYIEKAVKSGKISGNGEYTKKCQSFFEEQYGFKKCLLTTSCTDALEMAAILINIKPGDEVIVPSYTFVSTANAFALRGAKIIFADSKQDNPNIDPNQLEQLITDKTKAIVPVHYAGIACEMDKIMEIANKHNIFVIEDAAQAIDSFYKNKPLGTFGQMSTFSFHETKNIISGEGGMLAINDENFINRAEIIWEKGTNRSAFFRGEVDKYSWVDIGSSFLPSETIAAFLFAQLENLPKIQNRRKEIWNNYYNAFAENEQNGDFKRPIINEYSPTNGHLFYILCRSITERDKLITFLKAKGILAVFHYLSLHKSKYHLSEPNVKKQNLTHSDIFTDTLLRLPLFYSLLDEEQKFIIDTVKAFYNK